MTQEERAKFEAMKDQMRDELLIAMANVVLSIGCKTGVAMGEAEKLAFTLGKFMGVTEKRG